MNKFVFIGLCASTVGIISTPLCASGHPGAAAPAAHAAPAAPHMSAPGPHMAAAAPHFSAPAPHLAAAPPHFSAPAPHMVAAPHFSAPAPHMAAAPHFSAPAPHMAAAPHFSAPAPHMAAAQHFSAPASHMAAPQHFSAPASHMAAASHLSAPSSQMRAGASHISEPSSHVTAAQHMKTAPRTVAEHATSAQSHFDGGAQSRQGQPASGMQMAESRNGNQSEMSRAMNRAPESQVNRMNEGRSSQEVPRMNAERSEQPQMSRLSQMTPQNRASKIAGMSPANRTEAMMQMSPQQRAESMAKMSPELRNQFMGREGSNRVQNVQVERSSVMNSPRGRALAAAGAGAGAIGAMSAAGMMHRGEAGHPSETAGGNMARERGAAGTARSGMAQRSTIPGPPNFANPRQVNRMMPGGARQFSSTRGGNLAWSPNARNIPRAGNLQTGRPGALDPGGYTRSAEGRASSLINPNYASRQFAASQPNYQALTNANYRNILANRANWPWQLPSYAPGWFNNYQNPWNWGQSNWGNSGGFFGMLGNFFNPWGTNPDMGWIPDLNYYNGYNWDNQNYPCDYYAPNYYCPTPYVFDVGAGQFWQPGAGYSDSLPDGYQAPITVAIQEIVPTYAQNGQISGYQPQTFYYNAFWDPNAQSYGYYDYRQQFHWLTFPWLNSWSGANAQNAQIQNQQINNQQIYNPQAY